MFQFGSNYPPPQLPRTGRKRPIHLSSFPKHLLKNVISGIFPSSTLRVYRLEITNFLCTLKVHKHKILCVTFFAETESLWVLRACDTRFLKIVFVRPDIRLVNITVYVQSARKSFLRMLSQRLNNFLVCAGCNKIISLHAQQRCTRKNC
jgi:hypothetical protein